MRDALLHVSRIAGVQFVHGPPAQGGSLRFVVCATAMPCNTVGFGRWLGPNRRLRDTRPISEALTSECDRDDEDGARGILGQVGRSIPAASRRCSATERESST